MRTSPVSLSSQAVQFREGAPTVRLGLIALSTDLTSEGDLFRQVPGKGVAIHVTRVAFDNPTTPENLRKMGPRITAAAQLLVPVQPLSAICYSCTSASVVIGDAEITASLQGVLGKVPVVTPTGAARTAFSALGVTRIAVLTPYTVPTSKPMAAYFSWHGLDVTRFDCLGLEDDRDMAQVSDRTMINAAIAADTPDAEAVFISCTALPVIDVIREIEKCIGKPVVTSNQASAWAMSRLAGFDDYKPAEYGRLFEHHLPGHSFGGAA